MYTSFSTALSALNANAMALDVIGNNLANLNTPGFKASVVYFRDMMSQSLGTGGDTQIGAGTSRPTTVRQFAQGAIQTSNGPLDAAIQGEGFFVLQDKAGATLYTRAGNFQWDKAGYLVTNGGERVQGWTSFDTTTGAVNTSGPIGDILVPAGTLKMPVATANFTLDLNLNSAAAVGTASDFQTPIEVFDSLGTSHVLTITFEKTKANEWKYDVTMAGDEVTAGKAGQAYAIPNATGTLTFGPNGELTAPKTDKPIAVKIAGLVTGAADLDLTWSLYDAKGGSRMTQFGQPSAVSANDQDGAPAAQLVKIGLADGARLLAQYSNGQQVLVGQVALASVRNPESMLAVGNNNFQLSANTAAPAVGLPGTSGRGTVVGGAIEFSTVDIAREFTNLIVLQRGYQANSKVITTIDELSQDTINLKR